MASIGTARRKMASHVGRLRLDEGFHELGQGSRRSDAEAVLDAGQAFSAEARFCRVVQRAESLFQWRTPVLPELHGELAIDNQ